MAWPMPRLAPVTRATFPDRLRSIAVHPRRAFGFATTKRRLGVCKFRTKRIEIVEFHALNNLPEKVLDTLLHEIAHALAEPATRHGPFWKAVAVQPGATPLSCADILRDFPNDW